MKILISTSSFGKENETPLNLIKQSGFEVYLNPYGRQLTIDESKDLLVGKVGLIAGTEKLNEEAISAAMDLKYIVRLGTGMDNVDFNITNQKGIEVESTPNAHIDGVAELALGGILNSLRSIAWNDHQIKSGNWIKPMGSLLKGKTIGLIGLGKIAKRLAILLNPFICNILAYDPSFDEEFANKWGIQKTSLDTILENSNIISLHLPFSIENKHIINNASFTKMKKDVLIVNTSRGGLVNESALFDFLKNNSSAKAYLDTFEEEPYKGDLCLLSNVLMTGHIGTYAKEVRLTMEMEAAQKLINFLKKK
jgi:D-3-phosphoglycerate dehydrogenase